MGMVGWLASEPSQVVLNVCVGCLGATVDESRPSAFRPRCHGPTRWSNRCEGAGRRCQWGRRSSSSDAPSGVMGPVIGARAVPSAAWIVSVSKFDPAI